MLNFFDIVNYLGKQNRIDRFTLLRDKNNEFLFISYYLYRQVWKYLVHMIGVERLMSNKGRDYSFFIRNKSILNFLVYPKRELIIIRIDFFLMIESFVIIKRNQST